MIHELPVRPRPLPHESIEGYLLRIVARNGWQQSGQLLKHVGLPAKYYVDSPDKLIKLCEKLAPFVRIVPEGLIAHFSDQLSHKWLYDEKRALQDLRVRFPRLCPLCVNQTGFHWHWSLATVSHCVAHNHKLLDRCPKCGEPFEWHSELFFGCPKCDYSWEAESASELPEHQKEFRKLLANSIGLQDFIHDLTLALRAVSRPYDSIHDNRGYWPTSQRRLSESITAAYELLTEPEALKGWLSHCAYARSDLMPLGTEVVLSPISTFTKRLRGQWPIQKTVVNKNVTAPSSAITSSHVDGWIRPSRLRFTRDDFELRFQANAREVQHALGLPKGSIRILVESGAVQPIHQSRIPRDQFFDLRDLEAVIAAIPEVNQLPENHIRLVNNDKILKQHRIKYIDVLAGVFSGSIPAFRPAGSRNLSCIFVDIDDLLLFLLKCQPRCRISGKVIKSTKRYSEEELAAFKRFLDQRV